MTATEHPAEALAQEHFDAAADWAGKQLHAMGHAFIDLQPGDGTTYKIVVVRPTRVSGYAPVPDTVASMWVGTSFGQLYPWRGDFHTEWGYVADKWVEDGREWTARVIARFLNALCDKLKET